jgi:hypothetical protein
MPRKLSFSAAARQIGGPGRVAVWVTVVVAGAELLVLVEAGVEVVAATGWARVLDEVVLPQALSTGKVEASARAASATRARRDEISSGMR